MTDSATGPGLALRLGLRVSQNLSEPFECDIHYTSGVADDGHTVTTTERASLRKRTPPWEKTTTITTPVAQVRVTLSVYCEMGGVFVGEILRDGVVVHSLGPKIGMNANDLPNPVVLADVLFTSNGTTVAIDTRKYSDRD